MKYVKCKLLDGDNVIAKEIDVLIIENKGVLYSWEGKFESFHAQNFKPNKSLKIILEDGRSGDIIITGHRATQQGKALIDFRGSGALD